MRSNDVDFQISFKNDDDYKKLIEQGIQKAFEQRKAEFE